MTWPYTMDNSSYFILHDILQNAAIYYFRWTISISRNLWLITDVPWWLRIFWHQTGVKSSATTMLNNRLIRESNGYFCYCSHSKTKRVPNLRYPLPSLFLWIAAAGCPVQSRPVCRGQTWCCPSSLPSPPFSTDWYTGLTHCGLAYYVLHRLKKQIYDCIFILCHSSSSYDTSGYLDFVKFTSLMLGLPYQTTTRHRWVWNGPVTSRGMLTQSP